MTFKLNKTVLQKAKFLHRPERHREVDTYKTLLVPQVGLYLDSEARNITISCLLKID